MTKYVAGFLFTHAKDRVALVEKQRPSWQRGKLNGIGGHIEDGETPAEAQRREFLEEAGVDIPNWDEFAVLSGPGYEVTFFRAFASVNLFRALESRTDEQIQTPYVDEVLAGKFSFIRNLSWLIPMALHDTQRYAIAEVA